MIRGFERRPGVVIVSGPDAQSFLQSLVSQDLEPLADGESAPSLLLQPQGKLLAQFLVVRLEAQRWLLITDDGMGATLAEALHRFKIRVKVDIEDRSDATRALLVLADVAPDVDDAVFVPIDWGGTRATLVVGPKEEIAAIRARLPEVVWGDAQEYEAARIAAGVPRQGVDIDDKTIPQEAFLDRTAVSFTKGCFVGQELVCRIDTRGHVNRYLRRIVLDGEAPPGAEVYAGDKLVGTLTSVAGRHALGMVRREVEPPSTVEVRWPDHSVRAEVTAV